MFCQVDMIHHRTVKRHRGMQGKKLTSREAELWEGRILSIALDAQAAATPFDEILLDMIIPLLRCEYAGTLSSTALVGIVSVETRLPPKAKRVVVVAESTASCTRYPLLSLLMSYGNCRPYAGMRTILNDINGLEERGDDGERKEV